MIVNTGNKICDRGNCVFQIIKIVALASVVSAGYLPPVKHGYGLPVKSHYGGSVAPLAVGHSSLDFSKPASGGLISKTVDGIGKGGLGGGGLGFGGGIGHGAAFGHGAAIGHGAAVGHGGGIALGGGFGHGGGFAHGGGVALSEVSGGLALGGISHGASFGHGEFGSVGGGAVLSAGLEKFGPCPKGLERTIHGQCVQPAVSQDLFLFKAPSYKVHHKKAHYKHKPKVHYNLVFIRSPTYEDHKIRPLVVPPPKQQTLVYLLSKKPHGYKQDVIEVPLENSKPEVFFVDYKDGDNPVLPGGIDLKTALSQAAGPSDIHVGVEDAGIGGVALGGFGHGGFAAGGVESFGVGGLGKGVGGLGVGFGKGGFAAGGVSDGGFAVGGGGKGGLGAEGLAVGGGLGKGGFGAGGFGKGGFGAGGVGVGGGLGKGGFGAVGQGKGGFGAGGFGSSLKGVSLGGGKGGVAAGHGGGGAFGGLGAIALKAAEAAAPVGLGHFARGPNKEVEQSILKSVSAGHDPFGDHDEIIIDHGVKGLKAGGVSFGDGKGTPVSPFSLGGFGSRGSIVSGSPMKKF